VNEQSDNPDRDRRIVELRDKRLTLVAIGREVGLSKERVRQILAQEARREVDTERKRLKGLLHVERVANISLRAENRRLRGRLGE